MMQPRQPPISGERSPPPSPVEKARVHLETPERESESRQYEATVFPTLEAETGFFSYAAYMEKNDFGEGAILGRYTCSRIDGKKAERHH